MQKKDEKTRDEKTLSKNDNKTKNVSQDLSGCQKQRGGVGYCKRICNRIPEVPRGRLQLEVGAQRPTGP